MTIEFWKNLLIALVIFASALMYINRTKIKLIRNLMAERLRHKTLPKLHAIMPLIVNAVRTENDDLFPLFRLRADLESLCLKAEVLFDVERLALSEFLAKLSIAMPVLESDQPHDVEIDDLLLSGQRAINELKELGRK